MKIRRKRATTDFNALEEINNVGKYVRSAQAEINKMRITPRVGYRYSFDLIGLATLSKVFALAAACLKLLRSDLPDEAFGLSRSLVECANNLRFLTADPALQEKHTRDFIKYAKAEKAFWAHYALQQFAGKKEERDIRSYARQQGIVPDNKPARCHWSGLSGFIWDVVNIDHPLDGPAVTPKHKKISYAADYFQSSTFVHCSLSAIDNYFADEGVPFQIAHSSGLHNTIQPTLYEILIYIHSSMAYVLFGMNIDRPARLNLLFQNTLRKMKPYPTRRAR